MAPPPAAHGAPRLLPARRAAPPLPARARRRRRPPAPPPRPAAAGRADRGSLARLEAAVPPEQRPVNELSALRGSPLCSWAALPPRAYAARLGGLFAASLALLGAPVAAQTFDPRAAPAAFAAAAATGALLAVAAAALRIYLAWKYVGDRLSTAALEYEESGWYDGQVFVKPPEVLARDRLLAAYEVRPVLARLRGTLGGAGLALAAAAALAAGAAAGGGGAPAGGDARAVRVLPDGVLFSGAAASMEDLRTDDAAAAAEAEAQRGVPGYCADRYFRAAAGGERVCAALEAERGRR